MIIITLVLPFFAFVLGKFVYIAELCLRFGCLVESKPNHFSLYYGVCNVCVH